MRPVDIRKLVDHELANHTARLLGGRPYVTQMNPYEGGTVRYERFKRFYKKITEGK